MASATPADAPKLNAELRSSLQSKFAVANEDSEAHDDSWQSRDPPKAGPLVTMLPLPTDVAILRRYAAEAQKQHLREHVAQVYASAKILALGMHIPTMHLVLKYASPQLPSPLQSPSSL